MTDLNQSATLMTPRRGFFTRVAGVMALGVAVLVPTVPRAEGEAEDGPNWPGNLTGRHKQVTDIYAVNDGSPLGFVHNFLEPNKQFVVADSVAAPNLARCSVAFPKSRRKTIEPALGGD